MKRAITFTLAAALMGMLAFSGGALAAKPPGAGNGGGGGGGGNAPPDYGDLIFLLRDDNGVPIPSPVDRVEDPETGDLVDGGLCWQPIAFNVGTVACPTGCVVETTDPATVSVDQYNCGVVTGCSGCTQEVNFGRTNEARSSEDVFAAQLEDVVIKLSTADCRTLDPAGRLVASTVAADETVSTSTIDSPLQNLAIYRQLMMTGTIGAPLPEGVDTLDTAARGLGVASDKAGQVNMDQVAYINFLMGLDAVPTILPKLCELYREEVQGVIQLVEKCYLDYLAYDYDRSVNFSTEEQSLPNPAYIPDNESYGWFEYTTLVQEDPDLYQVVNGPVLEAVFADEEFDDINIGAFAQASDDTRAVINFMHENPVLGEVTPVPCIADPSLIAYDVSISDVSGLQVPARMVDGSEGREFFLTVANAGPDAATGTVTVTAIAESGGTILADLDGDGELTNESPFEFPFKNLPPNETKPWTTFFIIDIGERTTINWTAVAYADDDVNPENNSVTATTRVKVTGGGGGGGKSVTRSASNGGSLGDTIILQDRIHQ